MATAILKTLKPSDFTIEQAAGTVRRATELVRPKTRTGVVETEYPAVSRCPASRKRFTAAESSRRSVMMGGDVTARYRRLCDAVCRRSRKAASRILAG